MKSKPREFRIYRSYRDGIRDLKNTSVLIYWPHGFGDWVFLSYVLPLLDPSNQYYLTRFGDHYTSLFEGCEIAKPLYVGHDSIHSRDGAQFGMQHFGLRKSKEPTLVLDLPEPLYTACKRHKIATIVDHPFWEVHGHTVFPHHTKARYILRHWVTPSRLPKLDLGNPLHSCIPWEVPGPMLRWVAEQLCLHTQYTKGKKLCIIAHQGYTSVGKNWGRLWREDLPKDRRNQGQEGRDFMRLLRRKDPAWIFVSMEQRSFNGDASLKSAELNCVPFHEIFGAESSSGQRFGLLLRALYHMADLVVGVPTGPYHLAMAKPDLPTIGIWTRHFPSWYDEPKEASRHLVGRDYFESNRNLLPGTFSEKAGISFKVRHLSTRVVPGEDVLWTAEELLGLRSMRRRLKTSPPSQIRSKKKSGFAIRGTPSFIAVTVGVGPKYGLMAKYAARACHRSSKLETYVLDAAAWHRSGCARPQQLRFHLFNLFPNAETILYFDADILFINPFDPSSFENREEWICVGENRPEVLRDVSRKKAQGPVEEFFNDGFFIANRNNHHRLLLDARRIQGIYASEGSEQSALNAARRKCKSPTLFLPVEYNALRFEDRQYDRRLVKLAHLNGLCLRSELSIQRTCEYWLREANGPSHLLKALRNDLTENRFQYTRVNHDSRAMSFLPNGTIGEGCAGREKQWELTLENGSPMLWISGEATPTCGLLHDQNGIWKGTWIRAEQMPVTLTPILRG